MSLEKYIPLVEEKSGNPLDQVTGNCAASEPYALMVLGDSMEPEFMGGDVVIIEPDGHVEDGAYVLAYHNDDYTFRQLVIRGERWYLQALNDAYPAEQISGPEAVKGVITQKKRPGSGRKGIVHYT